MEAEEIFSLSCRVDDEVTDSPGMLCDIWGKDIKKTINTKDMKWNDGKNMI